MGRDRTIAGLLLVGVATLPACAGDQVVVIRKDHLPWYTADPLLLPSVTAAVGASSGIRLALTQDFRCNPLTGPVDEVRLFWFPERSKDEVEHALAYKYAEGVESVAYAAPVLPGTDRVPLGMFVDAAGNPVTTAMASQANGTWLAMVVDRTGSDGGPRHFFVLEPGWGLAEGDFVLEDVCGFAEGASGAISGLLLPWYGRTYLDWSRIEEGEDVDFVGLGDWRTANLVGSLLDQPARVAWFGEPEGDGIYLDEVVNDEGAHLPDLECGSWFLLALRCLTCPQIFPTFAAEMQVYTGCNA